MGLEEAVKNKVATRNFPLAAGRRNGTGMIGIWDKLALGRKESGVQAQLSDSPCAESYISPPYIS